MSFSWKGIFGINGQDPSGSQSSRTSSMKRAASASRSAAASPASTTASPVNAPSKPWDKNASELTNRMDSSLHNASVSSHGSFGLAMSPTHTMPPSGSSRIGGSFPTSLGWSPSEWADWSRDHGRSIHEAENKTALLGIENTVDSEAIKVFLETLMRNCDLFDSSMHHDAHEFLNFTLNQVGEDLTALHTKDANRANTHSGAHDTQRTYVHKLFQGILTNETRCLTCENVSYRDEEFLDLSINVSPYTSVSACLRQFSESEMLTGRNKFFCDSCSSLQEAEKRMKIRRSPNILALHLKRFKWDEKVQAYVKHACRVVFPFDLRLFNTSDHAENADQKYELFAIVIHVGAGAHQGHYISIVKIGRRWALLDDECVSFISESDISKYYGDSPETGSAYVLFYHAVEPTTSSGARHDRLPVQTPAVSPSVPPYNHASAPRTQATSVPIQMPQTAVAHAPEPFAVSSAGSAPETSSSPGAVPASWETSNTTSLAPDTPAHVNLAPVASPSTRPAETSETASIPMPVSPGGAPAPVATVPPVVPVPTDTVQTVPAPALFPNTPSPTMPTKMGAAPPMVQTASNDSWTGTQEAPKSPANHEVTYSEPAGDVFSSGRNDARRVKDDAPTKRSWLSRAFKLERNEKS